jgi:hypothetical protein
VLHLERFCDLVASFGPLWIYGSHGGSFFECILTQQRRDVCSIESWIGSGSTWLGEGSHLAHHRITGSIQGGPRIASGSPQGAEGDHGWIVCLLKAIKNPPRCGCRALHYVGKRRSQMQSEVDQSEPSHDVQRSGVDHLDHGSGLGEPDTAPGDPCSGPWASEAIRLER